MPKKFKRGDHVGWNSEAGRVRGVIIRTITSNVRIEGYVHHASEDEPQYFIKSDTTEHVAIHKGQALKRIKAQPKHKPKRSSTRRKSTHVRAR